MFGQCNLLSASGLIAFVFENVFFGIVFTICSSKSKRSKT